MSIGPELHRRALELASRIQQVFSQLNELREERARALSKYSSRSPEYKRLYSSFYRREKKLHEELSRLLSELNSVLAEATRIAAETIRRVLGLPHYDVVISEEQRHTISCSKGYCKVLSILALENFKKQWSLSQEVVDKLASTYGIILYVETRLRHLDAWQHVAENLNTPVFVKLYEPHAAKTCLLLPGKS